MAASWEAAAGAESAPIPAPPAPDLAIPDPKKQEPVTIERVAAEFLADIEARQMDESTRRKYRTMLKQLRAYAEEFGFRYLSQFSVEELTKFRATWKDGLRSGAKKLERVRAVFRFAQEREWIPLNPASKLKPPVGSRMARIPNCHPVISRIAPRPSSAARSALGNT